jgi:hypothetical protein
MRWAVYAAVSGGKYLGEFEAATKEEALEKAGESEAAWISLCHSCSSEVEDPQVSEMTAEVVE